MTLKRYPKMAKIRPVVKDKDNIILKFDNTDDFLIQIPKFNANIPSYKAKEITLLNNR